MHKQGVAGFPYYVGVNSLKEIATHDDRVCVLNILGGESSKVTPTSHEYSGGNVVFGTGPGRAGQVLETKLGPIPVYNTVKDGIKAGHHFNTGVVYLPPAGVRDGVLELIRANPELKKVIIITEKVSLSDARIIRSVAQVNGIDIFGANCLGVADAWNKVRIGGALGGSKPEESLIKGSIAIFSNSGNFTTTIAVYLTTRGWGTTTSVSSGKDVYIHYGPKEFVYALDNDPRSKGAVMYIEPGGYYEHELESQKPIVACIVGRWKAKINRACGHAGSLAGSGDDAQAKERWFMDYFGVDGIFTPENPVYSKKGAVVTNIAHIPDALSAVMANNCTEPDFEPKGSLSLKCWFANNNGVNLPKALDVKTVEAVEPYNEQIELASRQVGAIFPRENLKDASGASMMDPKGQVTKVHNVTVLEMSRHSLEENIALMLTKGYPSKKGAALANIALNSRVNQRGEAALAAAQASRDAGNSPNTVLAGAAAIIGKGKVEGAIRAAKVLIETFQYRLGENAYTANFDVKEAVAEAIKGSGRGALLAKKADKDAALMLKAVRAAKADSVFTRFLEAAARKAKMNPTAHAVMAALWTTVGWNALRMKKISKYTLQHLPWHSIVMSTLLGCTVEAKKHTATAFCGVKNDELTAKWSFTETAFLALLGRKPSKSELFEFTVMLGLIVSNGPGTISAQGAKGAVSADGPMQPDRVQVNKGYVGFLTHTGFAHGGNGFEAINFLMERFGDTKLKDPGEKGHGLNLASMAAEYAEEYLNYKVTEKAAGNLEYAKIPCINHPVFKGKAVNIDPREEFVQGLFKKMKINNVFLDFYHRLVEKLFEVGVSRNVYCVNIDAVIAVILLKMLWKPLKSGRLSDREAETAAFASFLIGRMVGSAAEIDDHTNRGRDMDTRTAASKCRFVS
jgi:succinyl-CoA synthetase alpha subunit/citrate synthase